MFYMSNIFRMRYMSSQKLYESKFYVGYLILERVEAVFVAVLLQEDWCLRFCYVFAVLLQKTRSGVYV